ncbi:MAG: NAD(+)/NADH kinase [Anaerolineae bacterium]
MSDGHGLLPHLGGTGRDGTVGIIANPASGKDIRRLVAGATTVSTQDKISMVRRILQGLAAAGVARVVMMPDQAQITAQALQGLYPAAHGLPSIAWIDMRCQGTSEDSTTAAAALADLQAGAIIVLGGDGTVRAVSCGAQNTPLLPLSTGTNNVLPTFTEATIAGLAAGAVARGLVPLSSCAWRHKWLEVLVDDRPTDRALVDLALVRGRFSGARAVWSAEGLLQVCATRADPATVGLSAIAGAVRPVAPEEPRGVALRLDPQAASQIMAPVAPGLVLTLGVAQVETLLPNRPLTLEVNEPVMVALDGEREWSSGPQHRLGVQLRTDGPWILDARRVMAELVHRGHLKLTSATEGGKSE